MPKTLDDHKKALSRAATKGEAEFKQAWTMIEGATRKDLEPFLKTEWIMSTARGYDAAADSVDATDAWYNGLGDAARDKLLALYQEVLLPLAKKNTPAI